MQRFEVNVVTGDKECAGTDANVFLNVIGALGEAGNSKVTFCYFQLNYRAQDW